MPGRALTLYAVWEDLPTVTFDANGGSVAPASAVAGTDGRLSSLLTPTRSGNCRFDGWFTAAAGGTQITTGTVFAADTTVYAHWTSTGGAVSKAAPYTVTFNSKGGSAVSRQSVAADGKTTKPADPAKSGFSFVRWYADSAYGSAYDFNKPVTASFTVYARWNPFVDVFNDDWYIDDVLYAYENGLMIGTSSNPMLFSPNDSLTRGMIVTILYRLEREPDVSSLANPFDDVVDGKWYANAIKWGAANEFVKGYGDGRFGPEDNVTRQDLASILMRHMSFKKISLQVTEQFIIFADAADISDYAMGAIQTFNKLGIVNGTSMNASGQAVINPKGNATRAEAAAMFHRFLEKKSTHRAIGHRVIGNRVIGNRVIGNRVIGNRVIGNRVIGNRVIA